MKRLVFIVEGDTEINFIERLLIPYLYGKGFKNPMNAQTITTNRKLHKKGGNTSYGKFKNDVQRTLAQENVLVTTLVDFFKLPTDFPCYTTDSSKIDEIEQAVQKDIKNPNFIPYIQRHEIEALMFSDRAGFEFVIDDETSLSKIDKIIADYPNPEDINNSPQTAPSKRLQAIYSYDKLQDGNLIFEMINFENILKKCPRFRNWVDEIIRKLSVSSV